MQMICILLFFPPVLVNRACVNAGDDVELIIRRLADELVDINPAAFEQWVFDGNPAEYRRQIGDKAKLVVDGFLTQHHPVTEAQKQKLEMAAQADLRKFDTEIIELRQQFLSSEKTKVTIRQFASKATKLRHRDLWGEDSFFSKVATRIEDEQQSAYVPNLVEDAICDLDRDVLLKPDQHKLLASLFMEKLHPSKRNCQFNSLHLKYQISQLPEDILKAHFSDEQWPLVRKKLNEYQRLRPYLIRVGIVERDERDPQPRLKRPRRESNDQPADATRPENPTGRNTLGNRGVANLEPGHWRKLALQRELPARRSEE